MRTIDLTVLVVVKDGARYLPGIVDTVSRASRDHRRRSEILVVVDPTTTDATCEVALAAASEAGVACRVERGAQPGLAAGWNLGIEQAKGDFVVRWDAQGSYSPELVDLFFKKYIDVAGLDRRAVVGGPVLLVPAADSPVARAVAAVDGSRLFSGGAGKAKRPTAATDTEDVDFVARYLCHRDIYSEVGRYETFPWACEDTEWAARARKAGIRFLLDPELVSFHYSRSTVQTFATQKYRNGAANGYFLIGRGAATGKRKAFLVVALLGFIGITPFLPLRHLRRIAIGNGAGYIGAVGSEYRRLRAQGTTDGVRLFAAASVAGHAAFGVGILSGSARAVAERIRG